jgi:hypothetical protein
VCAECLPLRNNDCIGPQVCSKDLVQRPDGWDDDAPSEYSEAPIGIPQVWVVDDLCVAVARSKPYEPNACLGGEIFKMGTRDEGDLMTSFNKGPPDRDKGEDVPCAAERGKEDVESRHYVGLYPGLAA